MRVQQEYNPTGNTRSFEATFADYHNRYRDIFGMQLVVIIQH